MEGDAGAPLDEEECGWLEDILPDVLPLLPAEARRVIDAEGPWERTRNGGFVTTCVGKAECVFVVFESGVAKCGIQKAYFEGRVDRPKPVSCHLFPIRVARSGATDMLNYEKIDICQPGRACGRRNDVDVVRFLRDPLVRKYGESWYEELCKAVDERSRSRKAAPKR